MSERETEKCMTMVTQFSLIGTPCANTTSAIPETGAAQGAGEQGAASQHPTPIEGAGGALPTGDTGRANGGDGGMIARLWLGG